MSSIWEHNLERIPIDHSDNKLSPRLKKTFQAGEHSGGLPIRIWEGVRAPRVPPKKENAPSEKLKESARTIENSPSPYMFTIRANIPESKLPTVTAVVRLTRNDGEMHCLSYIISTSDNPSLHYVPLDAHIKIFANTHQTMPPDVRNFPAPNPSFPAFN